VTALIASAAEMAIRVRFNEDPDMSFSLFAVRLLRLLAASIQEACQPRKTAILRLFGSGKMVNLHQH
jgi:hypothetical protein